MLLIMLCSAFSTGCSAQEYAALSSCNEACAKELEKKALGGDIESAREMSTISNYVNPQNVRYWDQIAAENGDPISQRNLAIAMLVYSSDPQDQIRGVFWLEKAAKAGEKGAAEDLEKYRKGGREALLPDPSKK
jgi:TPR repeat protein